MNVEVEYLDGAVVEVSPDRKFVRILVGDLPRMPRKWISATAIRETLERRLPNDKIGPWATSSTSEPVRSVR